MIISESWDPILQDQFSKPYIFEISTVLKRDAAILCPKPANIWRAFRLTPYENVKVVIILQDPYINGEADGLAMSSVGKMTPSLQIVFKELMNEFGQKRTKTELDDWAEQGVLLINTCLTTVRGVSGAHAGIGWEKFTGTVLSRLAMRKTPIVFMLWGKDAKTVGERSILPHIKNNEHLILKAIHPVAEARGSAYSFTGCGHFQKANDFLGEHKRGRIKWV